jgi:hypothetical protein
MLSDTGINWSDLDVFSDSGINWLDLDKLSDANVNWADLASLSNSGINFADLDILSDGHQLADLDALSPTQASTSPTLTSSLTPASTG